MARIRTIKPDFWTDPVMVHLTPLARLFYIGTWNFAMCDQGHLEDDPFRLKLQILPAEDCDAQALIDELVNTGRLVRLDIDGDAYLHVKTLPDHQKVDGRWTPRCPVCKHLASPDPTETHASLGETHRDSPRLTAVKESKGKERKGTADAALPRPEVAALCDHLASRIEENGSKRPSITKAWHDAARLLIDRDDRDESEAHRLIDYSQSDEFWRSNVLSMPTFRKQYDKLRLSSQRTRPMASRADRSHLPEAWQ